jgi:uncharacterized membrane protein
MGSWGLALGAMATVVNGIAAGIMVATVIGIVPMMRALPYTGYVQMVQFMRPRYDPIMPISNGGALLVDVVLVASGQRGTGLHLAAALLLALVITISVSKNVPVNKYLMSLNPQQPPDDWADADPRKRWQRWNNIRTSLAVLAFLCNAAALTGSR